MLRLPSAAYKWRHCDDITDVFSQAYTLKNTLEKKGLHALLYESEASYIMYCTNKMVMKISVKEGNKMKDMKLRQNY